MGIPVAIEYALPINFALSVGGEVGFAIGFSDGSNAYAVPIMAKVAWHPNFEVKNLDFYVALKMGIAIGFWGKPEGGGDAPKGGVGFAFGTDVGLRYFFTKSFGIATEVGFDSYWIRQKYDYPEYDWLGTYTTKTINETYPLRQFFRVGVTFKI